MNLEERIIFLAEQYMEAGRVYEGAGDARMAAQARGIANMLYAVVNDPGNVYSTIQVPTPEQIPDIVKVGPTIVVREKLLKTAKCLVENNRLDEVLPLMDELREELLRTGIIMEYDEEGIPLPPKPL